MNMYILLLKARDERRSRTFKMRSASLENDSSDPHRRWQQSTPHKTTQHLQQAHLNSMATALRYVGEVMTKARQLNVP